MLAELIRNYVDMAIEYEFARRDVDEDGYTTSAQKEEKAKEDAYNKLKENIANHNWFIKL